ncbi:MAG TPA: tRNA lysidine(34) synthetase TilS [Bacilli bacterium]|nr:tRNA lysidine(34) synthetase TilS [Bacilli bacterium]
MKEAYNFINNELNIKENDYLILAISGGPDSMALLDLLKRYGKEKNVNIVCAHVNHNTGRQGQIEEQNYLETYCKENNVIFEKMIIDKYSENNFENEARNKRYNFFEKLLKKYNAKFLFTAHHGDDLIETILMKIVRGSSLKGYSGFARTSERSFYKIVRPLIYLSKEEIIKYNEDNNIKYYIDNTNYLDDHTRNRYRKYILPELKKEEINVQKKFVKYSNTLLEYNDYIKKVVEEKFNKIYKDNEIELDIFNNEEKLIKKEILYKILEIIYDEDISLLNDKHLELIFELIDSNKTNSYIQLPNEIKVIKEYNKLYFDINNKLEEYNLKLVTNVLLPNNKNIEYVDSIDNTSNYMCKLNSKEIKLPLYVRTKKDGDKMTVRGMNGTKKINDILTDCKIPLHERKQWPIVVDSNNEIVWLPGLKKSKFDRTKEENYDIILRYY